MFKKREPAKPRAEAETEALPVRENIVALMYLVAAIGFALSLKWMSAPATARRGILAGELGFGLAIVATLLLPGYTGEGYV